MGLEIILLILLFGLFLIIVELFFVPGTTVVGILGAIALVVGVYLAYDHLGITKGTIVLLASLFTSSLITYVGIKRLSKSEFTVKTEIDGRVNEFKHEDLEIGDIGKTMSDLRPEGYAMIKEKKIIVHSKGEFIANNVEIVIFKIKDNKIFVKPIQA